MSRRSSKGQRRGTLVWRVPVQLVNLSASGCLLESAHLLEPGTAGELQVAIDGREYVEAVRICRVTRLAGSGSRCRAGAEFLSLAPPSATSLRALVAQLMAAH